MEAILIIVGIVSIILMLKIWRMSDDVHKLLQNVNIISYFAQLAELERQAGNEEKELEYLLKIKQMSISGNYVSLDGKINAPAIAARIKELKK